MSSADRAAAEAELRFGRFLWRPAQRKLLADGRPVALGARAMDLLQALVERRDRVVAKDELLDVVWPGVVVEESNLHVQISALRKVLGADAIATVAARGYRFVARVDAAPAAPTAASAGSTPAASAPGPADVPRTAATQPAPPADRADTLPPQPSPPIGRADELAAIATTLQRAPLLTVVGPAGVGKTRLALAAAHAWVAADAAGAAGTEPVAAWVEAAPLDDAPRLLAACAAALRLPRETARDAAALAQALARRSGLLVIDNAEHLIDAVSALARTLIGGASGMRLLVTSQERLRVDGERVLQLAPLALPPEGEPASERHAAVALFVERARAADGNFAITSAHEAEALAEVVRALDGLPLAIELAAARVRLLGVTGLLQLLPERLRLLTRGSRDAPARHQTLRDALQWSHALLAPGEQVVLRRLGVFVGGFTLPLAQAVAADAEDAVPSTGLDAWAVLEALGTLVDRSLVAVDAPSAPGASPRYRLLETMRLFALERLQAVGETPALRQRHARFFANWLADLARRRLSGAPPITQAESLALVRPELANLRAALDHAAGPQGDTELAVRLAAHATTHFLQSGSTVEAVSRLLALRHRAADASAEARALLLWQLGMVGREGGLALAALRELKIEAVAAARESGTPWLQRMALGSLAVTLAAEGDTTAAEALVAELLGMEQPDDPTPLRVVRHYAQLRLLEAEGRMAEAAALLQELRALLLATPGEDVNLGICELNLATTLLGLERHAEAAAVAGALLERQPGGVTLRVAVWRRVCALAADGRAGQALAEARARRAVLLEGAVAVQGGDALALLALSRGRLADAVRIFGALQSQLARSGGTMHPASSATLRRLDAACAEAGIDAEQQALWRADGAALDDARLVALALD